MQRDATEAMKIFDQLTPEQQKTALAILRLIQSDPAAARKEINRLQQKSAQV